MGAAHGKSAVELIGDIISVKLAGNFNKEGSEQYCQKVEALVTSMEGRPFAMLVDDRLVEGGTPEAYEVLQGYNKWLSQQMLVAKAIVIENVVTRAIISQRTPELAQQNTRYFQCVDEANDWLTSSMKLSRKST